MVNDLFGFACLTCNLNYLYVIMRQLADKTIVDKSSTFARVLPHFTLMFFD